MGNQYLELFLQSATPCGVRFSVETGCPLAVAGATKVLVLGAMYIACMHPWVLVLYTTFSFLIKVEIRQLATKSSKRLMIRVC